MPQVRIVRNRSKQAVKKHIKTRARRRVHPLRLLQVPQWKACHDGITDNR